MVFRRHFGFVEVGIKGATIAEVLAGTGVEVSIGKENARGSEFGWNSMDLYDFMACARSWACLTRP